jgi:hypothetical protein
MSNEHILKKRIREMEEGLRLISKHSADLWVRQLAESYLPKLKPPLPLPDQVEMEI